MQQSFRLREGRRVNALAQSQPRKFWKNIKKSYKNKNKKKKNKKKKNQKKKNKKKKQKKKKNEC